MDTNTKKNKKELAVIGLGNLLLGDEGFGVHLVRYLRKHYSLKNTDVIDGGTVGFQLIEYFIKYKNLIFIDAIKSEDEPGSIYRFNIEELPPNITFVSSIHEIGLGDILSHVKLMDESPNVVVIGIVPLSVSPNQLTQELSDFAKSRIETVCKFVLKEIELLGGSYA